MADNLKIQQEINKLISERNKMLEDGELTIQRQAKMYSALLDVMAGKKGTEELEKIIEKLELARNSVEKLAKKAEESNETIAKSFTESLEEIDNVYKKIELLSNFIKKSFVKEIAIASAGWSGFKAGFNALTSIGKGVLGVLSSITSAAFSVGKAILSIPLKIFDSLIEKAQSGGGGNELMAAYEEVRRQFGSFKESSAKNVITAAKNMQGELDKTGLSVWRVFGTPAERIKYFNELATSLGASFELVGKEIADSSEKIGAFQKGLGISNEDMRGVAERAITMGTTMVAQLTEVANISQHFEKTFGTSSKLISRDISRMMKDVKNFGSLSIKEMSEVALYSRKLGIEFTKLQGLIDRFDTFESAAESSAKLSQAFGVNINAFEMMKKQSPVDRMEELRRSFQAAGKSAENLSRQELKLIEDATGLDAETAKLALSSKNQGLSMDEIKKKSEEASKKQLDQATIMKKLADSIERLTNVMDKKFGGFLDAFTQGINTGMESSPEFIEMMRNIQFSLRAAYEEGVKLGRELIKLVPGLGDVFKSISNIFKPEKVRALFSSFSAIIKDFLNPSSGLSGNFNVAFSRIKNSFFSFFDLNSANGSKLISGLDKFFTFFSSVVAKGVTFLVENITSGFNKAADFLRDPSAFLKTKIKLEGILKIFQPIVDVFQDEKLWNDLWRSIKNFAGIIWENISNFLGEQWEKYKLKIVGGISAFLFGPAALNMIISGFVTSNFAKNIAHNTLMGITKSIEEEVGKKAIAAASESAAGKIGGTVGETFSSKIPNAIGDQLKKKSIFNSPATARLLAAEAQAAGAELGAASSTAASTGLGSSLAAGATAVAGVVAAGVAGWMLGDAIAEGFENESERTSNSIKGSSQKMFEAITSEMSTSEKLIEMKRQQQIVNETRKSFEHRNFLQKTWDWATGNSKQQEKEINASRKFAEENIKKLEDQLQKEKSIEKGKEDKRRILETLGPTTIDNIEERFKKVDEISKKLNGKDFDISKSMNQLKEKLKNIDFDLFGDEAGQKKEEQINRTITTLESIKAMSIALSDIKNTFPKMVESLEKVSIPDDTLNKLIFNSRKTIAQVTEIFKVFDAQPSQLKLPDGSTLGVGGIEDKLVADFSKKVSNIQGGYENISSIVKLTEQVTNDIKLEGINKSFNTLTKIVEESNNLSTNLDAMIKNPLSIKTRLQELATNLGIGSSQKYELKNNGVQVSINLNVVMETDKVEKVIVQNKDSVIRKAFEEVSKSTTLNQILGPPSTK